MPCSVRIPLLLQKRRCTKWQNVNSAAKMSLSASRSPIHTDAPTEHGSRMLKESRPLLTVLPKESTLAPVAFAQVRLPEPFDF